MISDSSGRLTDKSTIEYPDTKEAPEAFRFNPGKKKVIFPPDHPYYNATTKAELVKALADMPREYQFDKIGEKTFEHIFAQPDDNDIRPIAKKLEKYGRRVEIMPIIDIAVGADGKPIDDVLIELKNKVFPELHDIVKNPDLRLDDKYYDFTRQKKPNDLEKVIRGKVKDKKKQGTIAVIQLIEAAPESEINAISKRILKGEKVQEVIISTVDGELIFVNINGLPK